jgi:hypothetical protein
MTRAPKGGTHPANLFVPFLPTTRPPYCLGFHLLCPPTLDWFRDINDFRRFRAVSLTPRCHFHPHPSISTKLVPVNLNSPVLTCMRCPNFPTGICTPISSCLEEVCKEITPHFLFTLPNAYTPPSGYVPPTHPLPFPSRSASGLRLCVDFFDGGRTVLGLTSSLDNNNTLFCESIRGIGGIYPHFVPVSG